MRTFRMPAMIRATLALVVVMALSTPAADAITFNLLHSFDLADGSGPAAGLAQGLDGNFYGTTFSGGDSGDGTIFQISPAGGLTSLYSFAIRDGQSPAAGLTLGADGNFYGTTHSGGAVHSYGTVFQLTLPSALTTIHSFAFSDGYYPEGALVEAGDGYFYGTTYDGGSDSLGGTVFKISGVGDLLTLHNFVASGPYHPAAGLTLGSDGNFYGTTYAGGTGYGTVFQMTPSGIVTTLHSFDNADGAKPLGGLVQGPGGIFYGTTMGGGLHTDGVVFQVTSGQNFKVLHNFTNSDGAEPEAGLVLGTDGNLYGTTYTGGPGTTHFGTVFQLTPAGALTPLHNFSGADGKNPKANLLEATNGILYGTTYAGGANNDGTVFSISIGLGANVQPTPTAGAVGNVVLLLGGNLTGASRVLFNGKMASFAVISSTEIETTVPTGATSGRIAVQTPAGMLFSKGSFLVQ